MGIAHGRRHQGSGARAQASEKVHVPHGQLSMEETKGSDIPVTQSCEQGRCQAAFCTADPHTWCSAPSTLAWRCMRTWLPPACSLPGGLLASMAATELQYTFASLWGLGAKALRVFCSFHGSLGLPGGTATTCSRILGKYWICNRSRLEIRD